jgi:TM2 domain-containing membrane protein YozV
LNNKSSAGIAAVLSSIFSGLGQLYNGQIFKGLVIIFLSFVSIMVLIIGSIIIAFWFMGKIPSGPILILGLLLFFSGIIAICTIGIYSIVDAFKVASKK